MVIINLWAMGPRTTLSLSSAFHAMESIVAEKVVTPTQMKEALMRIKIAKSELVRHEAGMCGDCS